MQYCSPLRPYVDYEQGRVNFGNTAKARRQEIAISVQGCGLDVHFTPAGTVGRNMSSLRYGCAAGRPIADVERLRVS